MRHQPEVLATALGGAGKVAQLGRERPEGVIVSAVEVSFDDGATWAPARVERDEQTVIRAYGLAAAP